MLAVERVRTSTWPRTLPTLPARATALVRAPLASIASSALAGGSLRMIALAWSTERCQCHS